MGKALLIFLLFCSSLASAQDADVRERIKKAHYYKEITYELIDSNRRVTSITYYDTLGRITNNTHTWFFKIEGSSKTAHEKYSNAYSYNDSGNLVKIITSFDIHYLPHTTTFIYNKKGYLIFKTYSSGRTPITTEYIYNKHGVLVRKNVRTYRDINGKAIPAFETKTFKYDTRNNLSEELDYRCNHKGKHRILTGIIHSFYDNNNKKVRVVEDDAKGNIVRTETYTYNSDDLVNSETVITTESTRRYITEWSRYGVSSP